MKKTGLLIAIAAAVILLGGCAKDQGGKDDPTHGTITLTTDWTNRSVGIPIPESYSVTAGSYTKTLSGATNTLDNAFLPGNHPVYVYNPANNISVNGTTVTANYSGGPLGWFFTCTTNATVTAGADTPVTAMLTQQVGQVTLVLDITGGSADKVATVTGTLTGVAGSLDFPTGAHSSATDITLAFTKDTDGKYKATVNLLGFAGSEQKLTGTVTFTGGVADMPFSGDLTGDVAGFNTDKKSTLSLSGTVVETPSDAGFTGTINGWTSGDGDPVTAI